MTDIHKPPSPFYPGQPVPKELFVGRIEEINRIMNRELVCRKRISSIGIACASRE
jgi:hypothetical protein